MQRVGMIVVMLLLLLGLWQGRALAAGCEVVVVPIEDPPGSGNFVDIN